ncbi:Amino Acid-Polyamine-Organocation (APC) Family, partial [Thraustotheca clavata]
MVGFLELLEYIVCTSVSAIFVGNFFTETYNWDSRYEPISWFIFYTVFVGFFSLRGRILWKLVIVFAIICLAPVVLYVCGCAKYSNLSHYGYYLDEDNSTRIWASGDIGSAYFTWLPYTSWAFAGIESLSLVTDMTTSPKVSIPYGMLGAVWALFISSIALIYIVPSLPPGIATTTKAEYHMNAGFYLGYGWSDEVGLWLILPAQVGMAAGFILPAGRLAQALADSSLLPPWLGLKNTSSKSLRRSMTFISTIGFFFCTICYFSPTFEQALQDFFILAATFCYVAQLVGFVLLRTTYKAESNGFKSPFGIIGAVYSGIIFVFMGISIAGGFQGDGGVAAIALLVFMILLTIYYYTICLHRQTISKDEYAAIFRFTIIKFNNLKRKAAIKTYHRPEQKHQLWSAIVSVVRTGNSGRISAANKVSSYGDMLPHLPQAAPPANDDGEFVVLAQRWRLGRQVVFPLLASPTATQQTHPLEAQVSVFGLQTLQSEITLPEVARNRDASTPRSAPKSSAISKVIKVHPQPAANHIPNNAVNCKVEDVAVNDIPPEDRAGAIHVASLGIVAVIGGQYYGWNAAFATGFVPFFVSQILTGIAYVVYMSCTAEICGKIAFSGGSYGLSRVTLGYYCGYM